MRNNYNKYNLFKIYILQYKYKKLSEIIFKLTNHIILLDSYYLLNNEKKK